MLKRFIPFSVGLLILAVALYVKVFYLFYQQDEWVTLGIVLSGGAKAYFQQYSLVQVLSGTGRAFSLLFQYPFYALFPFQIWPFALVSVGFLFINSVLVLVLAFKIQKNSLFAFLAAVFFLCNSISVQAVTWFAANINTLPSATFLLLSLIVALSAVQRRSVALYVLSQLFAITSFLFKESGVIAFFLVPSIYYFWERRRLRLIPVIKETALLILYGVFAVGVHVLRMVTAPAVSGSPFTENSIYVWQQLILHALLYPIISLSQLYIPQQIMFSIAKWFQVVNYSHLERFTSSQLGVESIVSDFVSFILSVVIVAICAIIALNTRKYRRVILFSLFFFLFSFLPFIVLQKQTAYLEPRYFFVGSIAGSMLLGALLFGMWEYVERSHKRLKMPALLLLALISALFLWKHGQYIQRNLRAAVIESSERIAFFGQLTRIIPQLPNRSVIYVTGNNFGYYGIQELKVPLQQGPGFTFMVWFYGDHSIPSQFIRDYYLWDVHSQGYRELGDDGFGYYHDLNVLHEAVKHGTIAPSQVMGLYYDSDSKTLRDITEETREKLEE